VKQEANQKEGLPSPVCAKHAHPTSSPPWAFPPRLPLASTPFGGDRLSLKQAQAKKISRRAPTLSLTVCEPSTTRAAWLRIAHWCISWLFTIRLGATQTAAPLVVVPAAAVPKSFRGFPQFEKVAAWPAGSEENPNWLWHATCF